VHTHPKLIFITHKKTTLKQSNYALVPSYFGERSFNYAKAEQIHRSSSLAESAYTRHTVVHYYAKLYKTKATCALAPSSPNTSGNYLKITNARYHCTDRLKFDLNRGATIDAANVTQPISTDWFYWCFWRYATTKFCNARPCMLDWHAQLQKPWRQQYNAADTVITTHVRECNCNSSVHRALDKNAVVPILKSC